MNKVNVFATLIGIVLIMVGGVAMGQIDETLMDRIRKDQNRSSELLWSGFRYENANKIINKVKESNRGKARIGYEEQTHGLEHTYIINVEVPEELIPEFVALAQKCSEYFKKEIEQKLGEKNDN